VVPAPDEPVIAMIGCLVDMARLSEVTNRMARGQAVAANRPRLPNSGEW